jgi:hypothetical protein
MGTATLFRGGFLKKAILFLFCCQAFFLVSGCEQMFTYCPFTAFQTPASDLTPEQQIRYGEDALASGDEAAMKDAYAALTGDTTSADAQYTAAELGIELSGVPDLLMGIIDQTVTMPADAADLMSFIDDNNLSPDYLISAADNLLTAQDLGADLQPMDYVMGALGLALGAAEQTDGTFDFGSLTLSTEAAAFIQDGITEELAALSATLPSTDPTLTMLIDFQGYVEGILGI